MAIIFRVLFSCLIVLALACYLQVSPTLSLNDFYTTFTPDKLVGILQGVNAFTISLVIILLLGVFSFTRVLEAAWNVLFCASILVLLAAGTYGFFGPGIALPHAIYNNEAIRQLCETALSYQIPLAITGLIFAAGWLCASACGRVAITSVISYGLWYGISEFFSYLVHIWSNSSEPAAPEALSMVLGTPWVVAAVPGAFFLIYALLMSFFETFITHTPAKPKADKDTDKKEEKKEAATPGEKLGDMSDSKAKSTEKPVEPRQKTMPLSVTRPKTTGDSPAPKKLKTAAETNAKAEEKTAEAPKADAPKAEEKTAEAPKADTPKAEEKPSDEAKADAPKAEEKPSEEAKADAPKAEEKPSEEAKADAPKAEEKPSEEAKADTPKA